MKHRLDSGSLAVAAITLGLFIAALFAKGITHDLFLEAGVFLVSVKLIIMAYRNSVEVDSLHEKLDDVLARLSKTDGNGGKPQGG